MSQFNIGKCAIPSVWCGKGTPPKRKTKDLQWYYKTGSRYECMQKGFGAGSMTEKRKHLPDDSLQQIKYVGDVYEKKFKKFRIADTDQLLHEAERRSKASLKTLLRNVFTRRKGGLDKRAYNSTIVFLYQHGIGHVPACSEIRA